MVKALRSYIQHRGEDRANENNKDHIFPSNAELIKQTLASYFARPPHTEPAYSSKQSHIDENLRPKSSGYKPMPSETSKPYRLSQCRLKFYDDDGYSACKTRQKRSTLKHTPSATLGPVLYPLEEGDGVLVDSVGHVYNSKRIRPWTALPGKFSEVSRNNRQGLCSADRERSYEDITSLTGSQERRRSPSNVSNNNSSANNQPNAVTHRARGKMSSQPTSRSIAFQRRNQTTHLWTDSSEVMSRSLPTNSFMHRNFGSSASSPRSSRDATSEKTSPAGKPSKTRPSSSYSYDGGFFVGAHTGQAEYFVIHPDWVSEAMTIKKLSTGSKSNGPPVLQRSSSLRLRPWLPSRRCLSAPPKQRNPITWDQSEPLDIPRKF